MQKKLTADQTKQIERAAGDLQKVVAAAVMTLDETTQAKATRQFNDGAAVIRQVTELRPGLMTTEIFIEFADGEVLSLGGSAF